MNAKLHFLTLSLCVLGSCATDPTDSSDSDEVGKKTSLSGTYEEVGTDGVGFGVTSIEFESSGKLIAKHGSSSTSGTWKISKAGSQYQIKLVVGSATHTYYETWDGYQLALDQDAEGNVATNFYYASWDTQIPIGDVCEDNSGNSLGECDDDGNFACGLDGTDDNLESCVPLD
jgi:hypothetical protein